MASAKEYPEVVKEYVANESSKDQVLGLLEPSIPIRENQQALKGSTGKWRLIVDQRTPA